MKILKMAAILYFRCKTTKAGSAQSGQALEQTTNTQVKSDY